MYNKPKCDWCGEVIYSGLVSIGINQYHKKCIAASIMSFEVVEINTQLKLMELSGVDVKKAQEAMEALTKTLEAIE